MAFVKPEAKTTNEILEEILTELKKLNETMNAICDYQREH